MFDSNYNANSVLPIHHQSNNNNNNNDPFDDHLLSNFPSHLLDDELFLDTILTYHHPPPPPLPPQPPLQQPPQGVKASDERRKLPRKAKKQQDGGESSRRKAGKKDRHSKIFTAHGPRDRRMRLSLQIARKFFDLQDMLGFDKASKTIEWLFNKSRAAIKDLSEKSCTNIMSPLEDFNDEGANKKEEMVCNRLNNNNNNSNNNNNKGGIMCEMNEKRKQARARARERTKEKLMKNKECLELEENPNNTLDDNNGVIRVDKVHQLEDQMASVGIIENFLASSSSSISNFSHDGGLISRGFSMEFSGNRVSEIGIGDNVGLMQEVVEHSEYTNQVQALNCAFMNRAYNQGF